MEVEVEMEISEPRQLIAKRQSDKRPLPRLEILGAPPPTPNLWILSPIKHILGASCIGEGQLAVKEEGKKYGTASSICLLF